MVAILIARTPLFIGWLLPLKSQRAEECLLLDRLT
jgi:hypothetical protein